MAGGTFLDLDDTVGGGARLHSSMKARLQGINSQVVKRTKKLKGIIRVNSMMV